MTESIRNSKDFAEVEDGEAEAPPLLKNHVVLADDIKTSSHTQTPRHVTSLAFTSDSLCRKKMRQNTTFMFEDKRLSLV